MYIWRDPSVHFGTFWAGCVRVVTGELTSPPNAANFSRGAGDNIADELAPYFLHLLEETARHAGHAEILCELPPDRRLETSTATPESRPRERVQLLRPTTRVSMVMVVSVPKAATLMFVPGTSNVCEFTKLDPRVKYPNGYTLLLVSVKTPTSTPPQLADSLQVTLTRISLALFTSAPTTRFSEDAVDWRHPPGHKTIGSVTSRLKQETNNATHKMEGCDKSNSGQHRVSSTTTKSEVPDPRML